MENKNIIMLKHHVLNVHYSNPVYLHQFDDGDNIDDYLVIDVTSRMERNKEFMKEHPAFVKDLSPFYIGPLVSSDGVNCNIFEIFWQCGKVYPCHDDQGKPNKEFFKWRNDYYKKKECSKSLMRHACESLGYNHSDTLYFAYFDKDKKEYVPLDYVESRKKVYFPEYAKLVVKSESFKWLKSLVDSGKKIALVDFDGYNYYSTNAKIGLYKSYLNKCKNNKITPFLNEDDFLNINNMKDVINCPFLKAGHGFVLKALLQGDIEVMDDGSIKDNIGLFV